MNPIRITPEDSVDLVIRHADNQMRVYVNGRQIYAKTTENDPVLNDRISLQVERGTMRPGYNVVHLFGGNWSKDGHFAAELIVNNVAVAHWDQRLAGLGIIWDAAVDFELAKQ